MFQSPARPASELGDLVRNASKHRGPWPKVSVWHGSADRTVNPANADEIVKQWIDVHQLPSTPMSAPGGSDSSCSFADAEPATKHRIVQALFEQVEVLGPNEVWLYPSVEAEARGWAAAMSGEFRVEERKTSRGERSSPDAPSGLC
jgi:hypothetical protein